MRFAAALLLTALAFPAHAARESWTGSYQCGPSSTGSAYSSRITMLVDDGEAQITRESDQIKESLRGRVEPDGTLKLEGTGARKEGGAGWIYRFDGRIEGNRYEARGAMLSPGLSSRLRECSISLTKVQSTALPAKAGPGVKLQSSTETKEVPAAVVDALTPTLPETLSTKPRAGAGEPVERELDLAGRSDSATMEGTVFRGAPHRYWVSAKRGQTLAAAIRSNGARVDLYEPGATLSLLSSGFVVQGTRMGASDEGERVGLELPRDGRYLLLVRANGERAFYTLELKVEPVAQSALERWVRDERVWIAALVAVALIGLAILIRRKRDRRIFRSG